MAPYTIKTDNGNTFKVDWDVAQKIPWYCREVFEVVEQLLLKKFSIDQPTPSCHFWAPTGQRWKKYSHKNFWNLNELSEIEFSVERMVWLWLRLSVCQDICQILMRFCHKSSDQVKNCHCSRKKFYQILDIIEYDIKNWLNVVLNFV